MQKMGCGKFYIVLFAVYNNERMSILFLFFASSLRKFESLYLCENVFQENAKN